MKKEFQYDIYRYYGTYKESLKQRINRPLELKYIILLRKCQKSKNFFSKNWYKIKLRNLSRKTFIQIQYNAKIGRGFYIGHFGRIIINPNVILHPKVIIYLIILSITNNLILHTIIN